MRIIGITGGVGSGKSSVLGYLESNYGAYICQADQVAWELQRPGQNCYQEIISVFGKDILAADGTIDRKKLGAIVFERKELLEKLNAIMHPAVKEEIQRLIEEKQKVDQPLFVVEAALLLEERYDLICDEIWYIYASEKVRRERLSKDRGYSDEKTESIMKNQLSEVSFREQCKIVIDNTGDFSDTCNQIDLYLQK